MKSFFSVLAGIVFLVGFVPYILAILRGEAKPTLVSWIIAAVLDMLALLTMWEQGAVNGSIVCATLGATIVVVLGLIYGQKGWSKLDVYSLIGAGIGILIWQIYASPFAGLLISLGVIFIGCIPMIKNTYLHPEHESRSAWMIFWVGCVLALFGVPKWDVANAAQPISFFVIESIMVYLVWIHKPQASKEMFYDDFGV